ncbi:MAG: hypothetical protein IJM82_06915 [Synergistaceae bacterium]|nr:hypothetical protein [Synergistaceae bacterium]MBQ7068880.1 hypothetical protein [Synergistaceae bacterium]MBR0074500.1 hypothetical protein [Synergistaceae bacterium]MBR0316941.1 hypothetical protein [Synergistaceae bacterium]
MNFYAVTESKTENKLENIMRTVRQSNAMTVFNEMRAIAAENGYMSDEEIENEIACARREKRSEIKFARSN